MTQDLCYPMVASGLVASDSAINDAAVPDRPAEER